MKTFLSNHLKKALYGCLVLIALIFTSCEIMTDLPQDNLTHPRIKTRINNVTVVIHADVPGGINDADVEKISHILEQEIISSHPDQYERITVQAAFNRNKTPDYLTAYLLYRENTRFDVAKIMLTDNYTVVSVKQGQEAIEEDTRITPKTIREQNGISNRNRTAEQRSIAADVQFVFSTCLDDLATCVDAVERAYEYATARGYKAVKLIGAEESKSAVMELLASPGLIAWGRVGHGTEQGIILDDGPLYYTYFNGLPATALQNKTLFFTSCDVHNPPLLDSILHAGVQQFIGGIRQLAIGPSEQVFKNFWNMTITQSSSISEALNASQLLYYPSMAFGISGNGADYLSIVAPPPGPTGTLIPTQTPVNTQVSTAVTTPTPAALPTSTGTPVPTPSFTPVLTPSPTPPPSTESQACSGIPAWDPAERNYTSGDKRTDGGKLYKCINPNLGYCAAPSSSYGYAAWEFIANCDPTIPAPTPVSTQAPTTLPTPAPAASPTPTRTPVITPTSIPTPAATPVVTQTPAPAVIQTCSGVPAWDPAERNYTAGDMRTDGGKLYKSIRPALGYCAAPSSAYGNAAWEFISNCE